MVCRKQGNDRGGAPGRFRAGFPRETAGRTDGSSDRSEQSAAERGVGAALGSKLQAPVATSHRRTMPMGHFGRAEPACGRRPTSERISSKQATSNVMRGRQAERCCRLRGRNEPLKGEPHRRYRYETRPEGFREE
jgi:hypothetical protein